MKLILNENQFEKIIKFLSSNNSIISEQVIKGKGSDVWDYKKEGNNYYVRKKENFDGPWVKVTGSVKVSVAKRIFGDEVSSKDKDISKKDVYHSFFKNKNQGNMFRKWVNKWYPKIAKKYDLDLVGPHDNYTIRKVAAEKVKTQKTMKNRVLNPEGEANLGTLFFQNNLEAYNLSSEKGKTLSSLVKTGFKINKDSFDPTTGYYVSKCTQEGCAQYTYDMIGDKFGDAWQAYKSFNVYANVSSDTVKKMTSLFNKINKKGFPVLNDSTPEDSEAKSLLLSLVPEQSQFKNLELGTVVGLYYPESDNYDLAFFQSAIGKAKDNQGNWVALRSPYFCSDKNKCEQTYWKFSDIETNISFSPTKSLSSGKSFIPNTHLGFIGYIDEEGEPYVVHNVHKTVYAFPVSKMAKGKTLSIIWAGNPSELK